MDDLVESRLYPVAEMAQLLGHRRDWGYKNLQFFDVVFTPTQRVTPDSIRRFIAARTAAASQLR